MTPQTDIDTTRKAFQADLAVVETEEELQTVRDRYLGRKRGAIATLMKSMVVILLKIIRKPA